MTPRTRASNKDANFKVYYSKKVPKRKHSPHKSKTVCRRSTPVRDGSGKRQMVFLPEMMKVKRTETVGDSDAEDEDIYMEEEDMEEGGVAVDAQADKEEQCIARETKGKGKKRSSDVMEADDSEDDEPARPAPRRQRKASSSKSNRRSRRVEAESDDEQNIERTRTFRRQSTMTQLVDGRRPLPGFAEPEFKAVKRSPRLSWGKGKSGKARKDRKQRTLTQMIPRPEIMSDEDMEDILGDVEAEERDSRAYGDAIAQRLAQQELHRADKNGGEDLPMVREAGESIHAVDEGYDNNRLLVQSQDIPEVVVQSVEDDMDVDHQDHQDSYQPTQFVDAPATRAGRTPRRKTATQAKVTREGGHEPGKSIRVSRSRFSLLATPEKNRIREIPSSQSPADSPLSTQVTPQKTHRLPLKQRSGNPVNVPETPSRHKQVTFEMPARTPLLPPTLRKFESTIQDSEDEGDGIIEEDVPSSGRRIGAHTQAVIHRMDTATPCRYVGADTQATLNQIDQACANADEDSEMLKEESSQDSTALPVLRGQYEPSPELRDLHKQSSGLKERGSPEELLNKTSHVISEQDQAHEDDEDEDVTVLPIVRSTPPQDQRPVVSDATTSTESELPEPAEQLRSTPPIIEAYVQDTFPSTPMVIQDDSSDEEDAPDPDPTPPRSSRRTLPQPPSTDIQQSADLDGEPIQVPRSPSPQHETQQSHSSKAEQQLQNEWFSYTQYANTRPPQSSSMRAAPDAFSYSHTPHAPRLTAPQLPAPNQHSGYHPSQATTVDETTQRTPRKNRTQHFSSTHTTPHRIASSQPVISPSKPPPLFIPSSFPSPEKAAMEGWSSPPMGHTQAPYRSSQWASLEDFSIPGPPPVEWDD